MKCLYCPSVNYIICKSSVHVIRIGFSLSIERFQSIFEYIEKITISQNAQAFKKKKHWLGKLSSDHLFTEIKFRLSRLKKKCSLL